MPDEIDLLAEVCDDPDDSDSDYGRGYRRALAEVLPLISDLTDEDDCWLDHHGGCQAHGYLSLGPGQKCPHQEAKELLAAHHWNNEEDR